MKRTGLFTLMATAIVGAVIAKNSSLFAASSFASEATSATEVYNSPTLASEGESDSDEIANAIVTRSDVDLTFTNDEMYPWEVVDNSVKNGNCGIKYSTSAISMTYKSNYKTELSFDWRCYNYSSHDALRIYIDGVSAGSTTNSSYINKRVYLEPGEHVIMFKDSIGNSTSTSNYSYIKNVSIKEIKPLETVVLSPNSTPLTFSNNGNWPWTIEGDYIQNSNYGTSYSVSTFSTSFHIDKTSKFSFDQWVNRYDENTSSASSYHTLELYVNGDYYYGQYYTSGWGQRRIALEPGDYTIVIQDTIKNTTTAYYSRIKNVELSSDWVEVDISSSPGSLGVEVLYQVDILKDVEMLKIKGTMNSTDWATIKQMTNIIALDLSEAKFDAIPNSAFSTLSNLYAITLPEGVTTIGEYAFQNTNVKNVDIPSSVTSIGQYAFASTTLRSVNFKDDSQLKTIGYRAFAECSHLKEFLMPNTVTTLRTSNGNSDYPCETFYNCTRLKKIHFSENLTTLEQSICYNCTSLFDINIPSNLVSIRDYAFYNTPSLHKIDLPKSLTRIDSYAFYECGVDSIKLPLTLSTLQSYAFQNCDNLKYIELPSYIGNYDRNFYDCGAVEKVVCQSATPPAITNDPFQNGRSKSAITLVVPSFAVVNYKLDSYWYQFGSIIEGDDIDYWKITSTLSLTNNRRMNGKPDIDLYDGGKLVVGGAAPMEVGQFNYYGYESNPACLLNDCPSMTADSVNTKFYFESNKWYFFTPTHDVDLTKVYHTANASYVFRYYDGTSRANNGTGSSWKNVDNGKLLAGQGYIFHCNANGYMVMPSEAAGHAQIFATSDVTKLLSVHETTASANKNWNYVGNPYPAYYDIYYMDFTAPITVWTGSTYKAYSIADDNYVLRPMQSFFVQKPDAVDAIVFHKEGRQISSAVNRPSYAKARTAPQNNVTRKFFNLQITDDELVDEMRIVVNEEASMAYELECDASKFMSMDNTVPQLFSLDCNGNNYAINERPFSDGTVALGYFAGNAGFYTISAMRADGTAVLHDMVLNKTVELNEQDYTFYSDATESANTTRFVLTLTVDNSTTSITANTSDKNVSVYAVDGMIVIKADNEDASIYSIDGKLIRSLNVKGTTNVNVNNGSYIIKVSDKTFKTVVY